MPALPQAPPPSDAEGTTFHILQLVTRLEFRGAQIFAGQLAEGLARRGHQMTVASLYPPPDLPLEIDGAEVVELGGRFRRGLSPALVRSTAQMLDITSPDLVQANGSDTLKYSVLARRWSGSRRAPLVYRNISLASSWLRTPLHRWLNRWLVAQVDHVATLTPRTAEDFAATYGTTEDRLTVIPIGTPIPENPDPAAARRELARRAGRELPGPVVVHVASLTPEKDHATLLSAWARVATDVPDAHLLLVGDGPLRSKIERRIAELPDPAGVQVLGAVPAVAGLLPGADLLVLPSRIEGLPGVVLEAAAHGVPVVATRVGSVADAVVDGATGLLVDPGDAAGLAAALTGLLRDPGRRRALGAAARRHAERHYALEGVVTAFEALYRDLLAREAERA